jgi:hypothetical protein
LRAHLPWGELPNGITFLLGCGRSGTSALGRSLAQHNSIAYLHEPIEFWYTIDPRTDYLNFFGGRGRGFLEADDVTPEARTRFRRLFGQARSLSGCEFVLEKYPADGLRIGWLNSLTPNARFIHIIRDGRAVCRSIQTISRRNNYRFIGKPDLHQWWGRSYYKWHTLVRECRQRGILTRLFENVGEPGPSNFATMAALEWLVRVRHIRSTIEQLGFGADKYLEVRYDELIAHPRQILEGIEAFIGAPTDPKMIEAAEKRLAHPVAPPAELVLPADVFEEFALEQDRLGYPTDGVGVAGSVLVQDRAP